MNFVTERESSVLDREKNYHEHSDSEGEGEGEEEKQQQPQETISEVPQPYIRQKGNTGVKGVLADYASRQELLQMEAELKNLKTNWKLRNLALSNSGQTHQLHNVIQYKKIDPEEEDDEKFLEDDEFLEEYRRKRLEELKNAQNSTFGFLHSIKQEEFVDCIDKEKANTVIIIHLYQDYIPSCVKLNKCLQQLAQQYIHSKFVKIISTEADGNYDDIALPTLLIYKAGQLHTTFIRIIDQLGGTFDVDHVESLLIGYFSLLSILIFNPFV